METIEQIYQRLLHTEIDTKETIYTGITNTNFLINGQHVIRQKHLFLDPFYHFTTEKLCLSHFAKLGIAPKMVAGDENSGTMITEYIQNTHFLHHPVLDEELRLVAETLEIVHLSPLVIHHHFQPVERYFAYKDILDLPLLPVSKEEKIVNDFLFYYDKAEKVVCHNDVVRGNLLFHHHELTLIDYEYAGLNDAFFDHISFLSENDITDWATIEKYFVYAKMPIDEDKILTYFMFLDLLWFYWAMSLYQKTSKVIYKEIGQIKFERLLNPMKKR